MKHWHGPAKSKLPAGLRWAPRLDLNPEIREVGRDGGKKAAAVLRGVLGEAKEIWRWQRRLEAVSRAMLSCCLVPSSPRIIGCCKQAGWQNPASIIAFLSCWIQPPAQPQKGQQ